MCKTAKIAEIYNKNLWEKVGIIMKDIVIKHNGESIRLTEEDILHLWKVVVDLIGEEIWSLVIGSNLTITYKNTWLMMVMMLILYELVLTRVMMNFHAHIVGIAKKIIMLVVRMNTMTIENLKSINDKLVEAQLDHSAKKLLLKEVEAELLLNTDFKEELGNGRPTVDDKKSYILLKTKELRHEVNHAMVLVEKLKREYEIEKLNIKFQGTFLNTIAEGVMIDDD